MPKQRQAKVKEKNVGSQLRKAIASKRLQIKQLRLILENEPMIERTLLYACEDLGRLEATLLAWDAEAAR